MACYDNQCNQKRIIENFSRALLITPRSEPGSTSEKIFQNLVNPKPEIEEGGAGKSLKNRSTSCCQGKNLAITFANRNEREQPMQTHPQMRIKANVHPVTQHSFGNRIAPVVMTTSMQKIKS